MAHIPEDVILQATKYRRLRFVPSLPDFLLGYEDESCVLL
jgi:hypothetical protein